MNHFKTNEIIFFSTLLINLISNIYSTYIFEERLNKISLEFSSKFESLSNKLSISEAKFNLLAEKINDGNISLIQKLEMYQNNLAHKIDISTLKITADQAAGLKTPILLSSPGASNFDFTFTTYLVGVLVLGLFSYVCYSKLTSFFSWPDFHTKALNSFQDLTTRSIQSSQQMPSSDSVNISFGVPQITLNSHVNLPPEEAAFRPVAENLFDYPQRLDPELVQRVAETVNMFDFSAATPFF
jgi:hypothetical protein